jgi:hypothetical protein
MEQLAVPEWGYVFYPGPSPNFYAHPQIDVNICAVPTDLHYDPERLIVPVIRQDGALQKTIISHPWRGNHHLRVGYGRIVIQDRKNKIVEAYSLGGDLEIKVSSTCTCCRLTSPVPLFRLGVANGSPENVASSVVDKFEALVAIRRVRWGANDLGFQQRLTSIDPSDLYAAGLQSIRSELEHIPSNRRGMRFHETAQAVDAAIYEARESGRWPAAPLTLDELI